jgi:hypothetical protein
LPAHQRNAFRLAVLSKRADGKPGEAAFRQSMRLTTMDEFGFDSEKLSSCGLSFVQDRIDSRRAGIPKKQHPRMRRGKFD